MIRIIVMTHGDFGSYLIEAAEGVVGRQEGGVVSIGISPRVSVDEVSRRLKKTLGETTSDDGAIILVDMPGGTPCNVAIPAAADRPHVRVVGGVNLYMLVTAFNHRADLPIDALVEKMVSAGKRSIADIQAALLAAGP